jgi:hypothetical protein
MAGFHTVIVKEKSEQEEAPFGTLQFLLVNLSSNGQLAKDRADQGRASEQSEEMRMRGHPRPCASTYLYLWKGNAGSCESLAPFGRIERRLNLADRRGG